MKIQDFAEKPKTIISNLLRKSNLQIVRKRSAYNVDAPFSLPFSLATGSSRTIYPILDLSKMARQMSIFSDQDISVQINDDRDYNEDSNNKIIPLYANQPVSMDTKMWKVLFSNSSGATANIRIFCSSEVSAVQVIQ